ncbi:MAG: AMP-binding protein, partial [bacterium]|nr:AMP-binding protein [bacterium]
NKKANRFARLLMGRGITTGSIAAIMAEYSLDIPIAVLGTLKTGSAYLPMGLDYPPERKKYILKDSNAAVLLTTRDLIKRGGNPHYFAPGLYANHVKTIFIDNFEAESPGQHEEHPHPPLESSPHPLAYVIYTSGSAGKPKGVMVTHRSVVNYINWARKLYGQGEPYDFPLYSPLAF